VQKAVSDNCVSDITVDSIDNTISINKATTILTQTGVCKNTPNPIIIASESRNIKPYNSVYFIVLKSTSGRIHTEKNNDKTKMCRGILQ